MGQRDIPYEDAKAIKRQIENGLIKNEEWISFGSFSCKAGSVTGVVLESENKDKTGNKEIEEEYYKDRMVVLKQTPEQRAERVGFFKMFFQIMADKEPSVIELSEAKKIQLEFFKKHPYRLECDPSLFKPLLKEQKAKNGMFFHMIKNIVATDVEFAKYRCG